MASRQPSTIAPCGLLFPGLTGPPDDLAARLASSARRAFDSQENYLHLCADSPRSNSPRTPFLSILKESRLIFVILVVVFQQKVYSTMETGDTLKVHTTPDFSLNGKGDDADWARTSWTSLHQIDAGVTDQP